MVQGRALDDGHFLSAAARQALRERERIRLRKEARIVVPAMLEELLDMALVVCRHDVHQSGLSSPALNVKVSAPSQPVVTENAVKQAGTKAADIKVAASVKQRNASDEFLRLRYPERFQDVDEARDISLSLNPISNRPVVRSLQGNHDGNSETAPQETSSCGSKRLETEMELEGVSDQTSSGAGSEKQEELRTANAVLPEGCNTHSESERSPEFNHSAHESCIIPAPGDSRTETISGYDSKSGTTFMAGISRGEAISLAVLVDENMPSVKNLHLEDVNKLKLGVATDKQDDAGRPVSDQRGEPEMRADPAAVQEAEATERRRRDARDMQRFVRFVERLRPHFVRTLSDSAK